MAESSDPHLPCAPAWPADGEIEDGVPTRIHAENAGAHDFLFVAGDGEVVGVVAP